MLWRKLRGSLHAQIFRRSVRRSWPDLIRTFGPGRLVEARGPRAEANYFRLSYIKKKCANELRPLQSLKTLAWNTDAHFPPFSLTQKSMAMCDTPTAVPDEPIQPCFPARAAPHEVMLLDLSVGAWNVRWMSLISWPNVAPRLILSQKIAREQSLYCNRRSWPLCESLLLDRTVIAGIECTDNMSWRIWGQAQSCACCPKPTLPPCRQT